MDVAQQPSQIDCRSSRKGLARELGGVIRLFGGAAENVSNAVPFSMNDICAKPRGARLLAVPAGGQALGKRLVLPVVVSL